MEVCLDSRRIYGVSFTLMGCGVFSLEGCEVGLVGLWCPKKGWVLAVEGESTRYIIFVSLWEHPGNPVVAYGLLDVALSCFVT